VIDIVTGLSAASEALKITAELRNIDREIDKAGLKLRLVDLVDRLLATKEALQNAKRRESDLLQRISELETKLAGKAALEDEGGRLYELDDDGNRTGEPYCNLCHIRDDKLYRLKFYAAHDHPYYRCDNCETVNYV